MKLAAVEVELKALEMTQMRVIAGERAAEKGKPNPASSVLKIKGSELQQATTELLMDVVGPYALPFEPEREDGERWNEPPVGPDWAATIAPTYFNMRKVSIWRIERNPALDHRQGDPGTLTPWTSISTRNSGCSPTMCAADEGSLRLREPKAYRAAPLGFSEELWRQYAELACSACPSPRRTADSAAAPSRRC